LPVEGRRDDFASFLEGAVSFDPANSKSAAIRGLFRVRRRLGDMFGWDDAKERPIPGCTETTLSARLPDDLRGSAQTPAIGGAMARAGGGFAPLYRTDEEWAAEISNDTVHGVLHFAWVDQGEGRYRAQMAVYVKTRGALGDVYMKLIQPFRHLIVYPALIRQIGRRWEARSPNPSSLDVRRRSHRS
jgi:hypothetical protein